MWPVESQNETILFEITAAKIRRSVFTNCYSSMQDATCRRQVELVNKEVQTDTAVQAESAFECSDKVMQPVSLSLQRVFTQKGIPHRGQRRSEFVKNVSSTFSEKLGMCSHRAKVDFACNPV